MVDTPPPTVSGSLHVGHGFSYTHQDLLVRYQRMTGKNIAYPMGWDDNGLPTERRVQNVYGIRPEPSLPYDPDWRPRKVEGREGDAVEEVSRLNFIEACAGLTIEDEKAFEDTWRRLGLSIDWSLTYATIDEGSRRMSQLSFLDLHRQGRVYQTFAPTMWDTDFRTAVAQAEVEDRPRRGAFHDIRFGIEGGGDLTISTTRPELLGACIAVVAHPDDERYQSLFGKTAISPLFSAPVPILAAKHADPEKGTGILMVCTFGDQADVDFWKSEGLPLRQLIGRDGQLRAVEWGSEDFPSLDPERAQSRWAELEGLFVNQARRRVAEMLAESGSAADGGVALVGEPRPTEQAVKFYEKGDRPLEFVPTRQWFVRILDSKSELLEQGSKIQWHPAHMRTRYDHWVEGLNQDWCISRQRYAGVGFPVWYRLDSSGEADYDKPILASPERLPVDPLSDVPEGFEEKDRDRPGGFTADPDVMDTWATSSLTPQIISGWQVDPDRHAKLFPMELRPKSHEIIRTWAFYTIVKAWMHEDEIPWRHVTISGWVVDPDRKKMSKSKGNVVTPMNIFDEYSADAYRYWTARNRFGTDTIFDTEVIRVGKRLVTKLFNASRFVIMQLDRGAVDLSRVAVEQISQPLDIAFVDKLRRLVAKCGESFDDFDYATPLQATEELFWQFCDDYLELVKARSYGDEDNEERRSALATLHLGLSTFLRLFAPFLPHVTEEVWSWRFSRAPGGEGSVHRAAWPRVAESESVPVPVDETSFDLAVSVLAAVRGKKTQEKRGLRWPVARLEVHGPEGALDSLSAVIDDVLRAGAIDEGGFSSQPSGDTQDGEIEVNVVLAAETGDE